MRKQGQKIRRVGPRVKHLRRYTASIPRSRGGDIQNDEMAARCRPRRPIAGELGRRRAGRLAARRSPVTFTRDIAPIVYRPVRVLPSAGRSGAVQSDHLRRRAAATPRRSREVTASRYMPPWKPEPGAATSPASGGCPTHRFETIARVGVAGASRRATDGLCRRRRAGLPAGSSALPISSSPCPSTRCAPTAPMSSATSSSRRRVPGTRYVRGLEFRPGGRGVHHANIRVDPTPASRRLDEADPEPGYEGMILRSADYPDGHFLGWTPGQAPPLAPGRPRRGASTPATIWSCSCTCSRPASRSAVQPSIGLYFADRAAGAARRRFCGSGARTSTSPAARATTASPTRSCCRWTPRSAPFSRTRTTARAASQHGPRCPTARADPLIDIRTGTSTGRISIAIATPFWLPAGTTLEMEYVFDNSDANPRNPSHPPERVSWGWRSSDEMADVWIQVMTRDAADRGAARRRRPPQDGVEDAIGCETLIAREPEYAELRNDAASLYLELGQPRRRADAISRWSRGCSRGPRSARLQRRRGARSDRQGRRRRAPVRGGDSRSIRLIRRRTTISATSACPPGGWTRRGASTSAPSNRVRATPKRTTTWAPSSSGRAMRRRGPHLADAIACDRSIPKRISISRGRWPQPVRSPTRVAKPRSPKSRQPQPKRSSSSPRSARNSRASERRTRSRELQ